ncbi:MAG: hypothetical protein ACLTW7_14885, partial [Enterococcus sp.]|uniref:hypothetical protein n=1 Tax=Enterococcus sp. TaxID=35783 RepID=UPI0039967E30
IVNTSGKYSEESWKKFQEELVKAKEMLEKDDATIAELDKTEKDLREAFDALSIKISDWFPDPGLAKTVADQLKVAVDDEIFQNKLDEISRLYCQYMNIKDLTGLRYLKN